MAGGLNQKIKITVVKAVKFPDLVSEDDRNTEERPGEGSDIVKDCPFFKVDQEFIVVTDPLKSCMPEGFCDWAWADIWKDVLLVASRAGNLPADSPMRNKPQFTCCTDGLRPIVFKIEPCSE